MLNQNVIFDEVYDKFALRIVYKRIARWKKISSLENIFYCNTTIVQVQVVFATGYPSKSTGCEACILL
jgi:hypothetical protein